jgi:hypothetical protein
MSNTSKFRGFQKEERNMSATPMRIVYSSPTFKHVVQRVGTDSLLAISLLPDGSPEQTSETMNHDPYAIRDEFFEIHTPAAAAAFLPNCGLFWHLGAVLWSQFRHWQKYLYFLRQARVEAEKTPEGWIAWKTAELGENELFTEELQVPRGSMVPGNLTEDYLQSKFHESLKL